MHGAIEQAPQAQLYCAFACTFTFTFNLKQLPYTFNFCLE